MSRRPAHRVAWAIADQALSSASNIIVLLVLAHLVDARGVGDFSAAFLVYLVALNICRSLISEPLVIVSTDAVSPARGADAIGASLILGVALAGLTVSVGLLMSGSLGDTLVVLGVVLPLLLVQDTWRFICFASGSPRAAALNDGTWLVVGLLLIGGLAYADGVSSASMVLAWGLAGSVAAGVACLQARAWPRVKEGFAWAKSQRKISLPLLLEYGIAGGASQLALVIIGIVCGLVALGHIRLALALLGPAYVLFQGVSVFAVPELVRLRARGAVFRRASLLLQLALLSAAAVLMGILLSAPDIGRLAIGPAWPAVQRLILPLGVFVAAEGAMIGARAGLRASARVNASLLVRATTAPVAILLVFLGATWQGVQGAAWAMAAASCVGALAWTWTVHRRTTPQSAHLGKAAPNL